MTPTEAPTPPLPSESPSSPLDPSQCQWKPPPHLEARFLRRRRYNNAPPSSTAATTRRQTLLEARKSLLRARAQHVERVRRSRADSDDGVSERLLALQASLNQAQKSRDAILAKIADSCASEVAKAKRTAVEMRKRREEEKKALKESVEERMVEAEKRRKDMLRERGRKRRERGSSSGGETEARDEIKKERAVRTIQRAWREQRDRKTVEGFVALELTVDGVRKTDFMEISKRLRDPEVLAATEKLLRRCGLLEGRGEIEGAVEKACRTFLSAYLILGHPAEVLSHHNGDAEKALVMSSKDLLIPMESFLSSPSFPPPDALYEAWAEFSTAFETWKSRDQKVFVDMMLAQYAELDLIWQKVKGDTAGGVASDFREGIRQNQMVLIVRLKRLVSHDQAMALIRKVVKETRRARLPKKEKRDTRPREAPSSEASAVAAAATTAQPPSQPQPPAPQPTPGFGGYPEDGMLSNRQIIHELVLDKEFRLKPRTRSQVEQMVENTAKRAFWDTMREDIAEGKLEKWIPPLAETVRVKILRLLDPKGSLYRAVSDSIDVKLIEQQCRIGSYNHERLLAYVLDLLPRICSPARDEDVQALIATSDEEYTVRLQKLLDVLEAMQLDHANFLLMLSAPTVIPEAIPYERRQFAADLAANRTTLQKTKQWLLEARGQLPPNTDAKQIHAHAFLNLIFSLDDLNPEAIPETFHMDHARIRDFGKTMCTAVFGGAIGVTVKTLLRRDVRSLWGDLHTSTSTCLSSSNSPEDIANSVRGFVESTGAIRSVTLDAVRNAVLRILQRGLEDPVVRVVYNRIRGFVKERVLASSSSDRIRLAASAGEVLTGWGVGEWIGDVVTTTEKLQVWRNVDIRVAGEWYSQILDA